MDKQHTTNYYNTFIEVADDSKAREGITPPAKEPKTAAQLQYEMLIDSPYHYTSDDVLYASNGQRKGLSREQFFSKGQPCLRTLALCKRYGWGIHCDHEGKVAIYAVGSPQYEALRADETIKRIMAIRSSRKS